ncbi:hypothetical protein WN51_01886 [Melipona quadrifasciata]|uniref:Uncharacterized protein n=1 Tax=Melipona quadrifasciata TaxID=166423 RepID=A0A0M8ZZR7_9HYME|nr:hypothetical protein WN51_01886 [Melipona quadrifasciata]
MSASSKISSLLFRAEWYVQSSDQIDLSVHTQKAIFKEILTMLLNTVIGSMKDVPPLLIMMTKDGYVIIKSPLDRENKLDPSIAQVA